MGNAISNTIKINNYQRKLLFYPLIIAELFFLFTLLLYIFGPVTFEKKNGFFVVFLLLLYQGMFILGYSKRMRKLYNETVKYNHIKSHLISKKKFMLFLKILIICTLVFQIISFSLYTNINPLGFNFIISKIIGSIENPLIAYTDSFSFQTNNNFIINFLVLYSPFLYLTLFFSIYYFKKLPFLYKLLIVVIFFYDASKWIIMGRNKGVFDLFIILFSVVLFKSLQAKLIRKKNTQIKKIIKKTILFVFLIIIFLLVMNYFTNNIASRTQYFVVDNDVYNSLLIKITPKFSHSTLLYLTSYLTQGYRTLSYIVYVDWTPMFGIGNSTFLIANIDDLFSTDLFQYTYQYKLASYGINSTSSWHTLYTWFANDFHWIGVTLVMYILGFIFASISFSSIITNDIVTYPLFSMFFMIVFYMSGNNQVFSYPYTFIGFWFLLLYWILANKKIVFPKYTLINSKTL